MTFLDDVKNAYGRLIGSARDEHWARQEKAEEDVSADEGVAGSRASDEGDDGNYVGRTSPQFDADVQESGAEARSEATRSSKES